MGIVYPDRYNLLRHDITGVYGSLNDCLRVVRAEAGTNGAYECALNCRGDRVPFICERTVGNEQ